MDSKSNGTGCWAVDARDVFEQAQGLWDNNRRREPTVKSCAMPRERSGSRPLIRFLLDSARRDCRGRGKSFGNKGFGR